MLRVRATCACSGPSFSPSAAERETGLTFFRKSEPGQQSELDRFQGHSPFYGRAELALQEYGELADLTARNSGLDALGRSIESLRRAGAVEIMLRFDVEFAGACSFQFSPELLKKLNELAVPLVISCFETDVTEEMTRRGAF